LSCINKTASEKSRVGENSEYRTFSRSLF